MTAVAPKLKIGQQLTQDELVKIVGEDVVSRLHAYSDAIIEHTEENLASSRAIFEELRGILKDLQPDRKFITFPIPPYDPPAPSLSDQLRGASIWCGRSAHAGVYVFPVDNTRKACDLGNIRVGRCVPGRATSSAEQLLGGRRS